jgi:hypothetical protein
MSFGFEELKRRAHTKFGTYIQKNGKVFCKECQTIQPVVDVFAGNNEKDKLLQMSCGHRRWESGKPYDPAAVVQPLAVEPGESDVEVQVVFPHLDKTDQEMIHAIMAASELPTDYLPSSELQAVEDRGDF